MSAPTTGRGRGRIYSCALCHREPAVAVVHTQHLGEVCAGRLEAIARDAGIEFTAERVGIRSDFVERPERAAAHETGAAPGGTPCPGSTEGRSSNCAGSYTRHGKGKGRRQRCDACARMQQGIMRRERVRRFRARAAEQGRAA